MGAIYKGSTLVSNAIRTINNIDDTSKGCETTYSSCKVEECVSALKNCINTQSTELTSSINLKLAKTTETTNAGKAVIVDSCGNLVFGTAGIDKSAVQSLIDNCVNTLSTCLTTVTTCLSSLQTQTTTNTTDITNLKACSGLTCTGTVTSVNSITSTNGNIDITCVACSGTANSATNDNCGHIIDYNYCDATYSDSKLTLTRSNGQCTELTIQAGSAICEDNFVHVGQLGDNFTNFDCFKACLTTSPGVGHWQGSFQANSTWYGFTWVPHRNGIGGDNFCYGMLTYWKLTGSDTTIYHCKYASGTWYQGISFSVVS